LNMKITEKEIEKEFGEFLNLFNKETDRGASLVAASILDEKLYEILKAFFIDDEESIELLDGKNAILGTFVARISACYCLGLIQENEFAELNIFRRIRNEFGHKWKDVTFETQKIRDLCFNLPWLGPVELERDGRANARSRFNMAIAILLTDLYWHPVIVESDRRKLKLYRERKPLEFIAP
jgi:mannitol operon repressor